MLFRSDEARLELAETWRLLDAFSLRNNTLVIKLSDCSPHLE